jgi:hypothetical protein
MFPQRLSTSFRLLLYMYSSFDDQFDEPQIQFQRRYDSGLRDYDCPSL